MTKVEQIEAPAKKDLLSIYTDADLAKSIKLLWIEHREEVSERISLSEFINEKIFRPYINAAKQEGLLS